MGTLVACCRRRTQDFSFDFDSHDNNNSKPNGMMTYNGLESIINSCSYEDGESGTSGLSGTEGCVVSDSLDEEVSSCSSSKDTRGSSFSYSCFLQNKLPEQQQHPYAWESQKNRQLCGGQKVQFTYTMTVSDIEDMKEKFAKLLLGDDSSGGARGISTALALSHAIGNLSTTVFGELWKLEPLSEEKKARWRREMDWLLSPTNYMVELVPAQQSGNDGQILDIMTPKARPDIHINLPALQQLDAMLIEVLESMVNTEFWYEERGSRDGAVKHCRKWWLPSPSVPDSGVSQVQRKQLVFQAKLVHQVLKAAKSINEQVLLQMPLPDAVKDALPKSARTALGEDLHRALTTDCVLVEEIFHSLNLASEHSVLSTVNRLESAVIGWRREASDEMSKRSPMRYPWTFGRDNSSNSNKLAWNIERAEALLQLVKSRFPNLPPTFLDAIKVRYNTDIGHSILEAYSRVLVSLAFSILSRMAEILLEDDLKKPTIPMSKLEFDLSSEVYLAGITDTPSGRIRSSLLRQMNAVDGRADDRVLWKKAAKRNLQW